MLKFVLYDLTTFVLKNLRRLFDKYAVTRAEHDALVKSASKSFSNFVAFSENPNFITVHMYKVQPRPRGRTLKMSRAVLVSCNSQ